MRAKAVFSLKKDERLLCIWSYETGKAPSQSECGKGPASASKTKQESKSITAGGELTNEGGGGLLSSCGVPLERKNTRRITRKRDRKRGGGQEGEDNPAICEKSFIRKKKIVVGTPKGGYILLSRGEPNSKKIGRKLWYLDANLRRKERKERDSP